MLKAFAAFLLLAPLVVANPVCSSSEYQAEPIIIRCIGSGGDENSNTAEVELAAGQEYVLAILPKGMSSFKASLRSQAVMDLMLREVSTKKRVDSETSAAIEYHGMRITSSHQVGAPSTESIVCAGSISQDLQLVVKNSGPTQASAQIGYYYDPWIPFGGVTQCPWTSNTGCLEFSQAKFRDLAMQYGMALQAGGRTCTEAWQKDAVPETKYGSHVLYWRWPAVYRKWASQAPNAETDARGMYKFATNGGFEAGKEYVDESSFNFLCKINSYKTTFIDPCCAKLRTAFTDETDAFNKMTDLARTNGRPLADDIFWEICKSIPDVPFEFTLHRDHFSTYWHSGGPMVAADLKSCYPNGGVAVKPTAKPLFQIGIQGGGSNVKLTPEGKKPWESDGTEQIPAALADCSTYPVACPAGMHRKAGKCADAVCHVSDYASCCSVKNMPKTTGKAADSIRGLQPSVQPSALTPAPPLKTTTVFGITMQPGILHGRDIVTSTGPNLGGYGVAVAAGTAVAAGVAGGAVAIHHMITKQQQEAQELAQATGQTPAQAASEVGFFSPTIKARTQATEAATGSSGSSSSGSGSLDPIVISIIITVGCAGFVALGVAAFFFLGRRKSRDTELSTEMGTQGFYGERYGDQEPLFGYGMGGSFGQYPQPFPQQAMGMYPPQSQMYRGY